jgi:hypothetical protein
VLTHAYGESDCNSSPFGATKKPQIEPFPVRTYGLRTLIQSFRPVGCQRLTFIFLSALPIGRATQRIKTADGHELLTGLAKHQSVSALDLESLTQKDVRTVAPVMLGDNLMAIRANKNINSV